MRTLDLAVAGTVAHFVVSCCAVVVHLATTWDPEPAVETGWTTGKPLWRVLTFPIGELPPEWFSLGARLAVLPINSCAVGVLVALVAVARRRRAQRTGTLRFAAAGRSDRRDLGGPA